MKKVVTIIGVILCLLWMGLIFYFSSRTATELDVNNSFVAQTALKIYGMDRYNALDAAAQKELISTISFVVSKTAHYLEYGALALFAALALVSVKKKEHRYISIFLFVLLYALSDEVHQKYVDGRTSRMMDVCYDTLGGLTMILLIELVLTWASIRTIKKNRKMMISND